MDDIAEAGIVAAPAEKPEVVTCKGALSTFLEKNAASAIGEEDSFDDMKVCIRNPWGDPSLVIICPEDDPQFYEHLNAVILPERLSAIWHSDTKDLEVIWTAYQLAPSQKEIVGRQFEFKHEHGNFACEFGKSSTRLLSIAKYMRPIAMSGTSFRNLFSFMGLTQREDGGDWPEDMGEPTSFWIRNIEWQEETVLEIIRSLNFYLTYYDNRSQTVVIHTIDEDDTVSPRVRYISGSFPKTISSRKLDDILINFWNAAHEGDEARRFLYYYRIIEYASFSYLDGTVRWAIKKILASPNANDDASAITERLIAAIAESKLDEYGKFAAIIRETVDIKLLWAEVNANKGAFTTETKFDGGFPLQALVAPNPREEDFIVRGHEVFTKAIRDLRNGLSHAREQKSATVITPTINNFNLLRPWVNLIATAAGEVVLYKGIP
jgi:hypothetical protein